jgi:hypothetical protein
VNHSHKEYARGDIHINNCVNAEVEFFYQLLIEVYGSQLVQPKAFQFSHNLIGVKTHSREERKKGSNRFFTIIAESFMQ